MHAMDLFIIALLMVLKTAECQLYNELTSLRTKLMQNYSRNFRPHRNQNQTLELKCRFFIKTVKDIDHSKGVLSSLVMLEIHWLDDFIQWNPSEYTGLESIYFPVKEV